MHCKSSTEQIKLENIYGEQASVEDDNSVSTSDILHGSDVFSGLKLSDDNKMVINGFFLCVSTLLKSKPNHNPALKSWGAFST